jgi:hypothetical protein
MIPDPRWIDALKLPARAIAGLAAGAVLVLVLDHFAVINLADIHALARPFTLIAAVVCSSLALFALGGVIYDSIAQRHRQTLLGARRAIREVEADRRRAERQRLALQRLDYLAEDEIHYVAACLRKNEQSFTAWVHSPHISNLQAAGLVGTPGGTHHQDYYPFYFIDFAWQALLKRKDEFIAKDDEAKRRKAAEEKEHLRRR